MTKLLDLKNHSIIAINQNNYTKEDNYKKVYYLDTDNITNNRINAFLKIDLTKEKLPSRAKRKCSINSIIYSSVRPNQRHFGIIKEIPKNFLVSTAFIVIDIIDLKKLDPNYLYYYITQDKITHYLQRIAECGTSSYPSITPLDFLNIEIKLYPLETQQKIARTLSILDQKIENNHKINELLHKILELLYEQYFVRFDFLDENNKPYQTSGGKMKFSKELNRLIPNDFEVKTLGELTQLKVGNKNANHSSNQGKYPFFTCSNNPLRCETYQFEGKHIIISGNGNFYVTHYDGKFDAYQRTYVVNPNNPNHYVLIYLFVKSYTNYLKLQSRGSIIKFITKSDIENIKIVLPNLKTYTKWNNVLKIIENNNQSTQTLTALRDFLLPLLLKQQVKPE
ncbi:restriction endonuclease subunit S [Helicobacter pylori]|uniref:restriction endonuclease subunit S n=1 Tax=Helicobacter pylori TaxID=210 RepID=UPI0009932268|nr:restriction endonuclease subunit S [Helicobacter pylori]OOP97357.1 type I restriction endonuclease subunit S [Helicobacter pylori]PDW94208.1 type I restriction endonuclease subunit S [Helicobacter pylori]PDX21367.1 type I restriction endonuclease subunit S [Helicobacter pylori]WQU67136.1 restriction endonuclease subunit S [Helicobacter pylori]